MTLPLEPVGETQVERPAALYVSVAIIATCGIVYELIIGATSSYLLGDSVWQFSITIGLFLSALGLGSWISQWFHRRLFTAFIATELAIALVGGFSALLLFGGYTAFPEAYPVLQYGLTLLIGTMVGLEIPLLLRLLENRHSLRYNAAYVLSLDYAGGLVGSLTFPLLLLPQLGLIKAALLTGLLNASVVVLGLWVYATGFIHRRRFLAWLTGGLMIALVTAFVQAPRMEEALEQALYRDPIIHSEQSAYQRITLTKEGQDLRLFINGNLQYSSMDEYRYHEALVHIPVNRIGLVPRDVLILGGGDGLAARELLKYPGIRRIALIDLDPAMTRLHRTHPSLSALNQGSLSDARVEVHNVDALKYLQGSREFFDLVIIDLPDPNHENLVKLYTREFYALTSQHLRPWGAVVVQASSPYFAREAFWCIAKTLRAAALTIQPYHVDVPTFGDWGFILASRHLLPNPVWQFPVDTRWLAPSLAPGLFQFAKDEDESGVAHVAVNTTFNPVLLQYYRRGWNVER